MYGKLFASAFTGSMLGAGADVFAVWSYVIASTVDSRVELNPRLLAAIIGMTEERVSAAVEYLCAPDPHSRNKDKEGRRLLREGEFQYFVTGHIIYRKLRNEDDRREYNRIKKAESRAKLAAAGNVKQRQTASQRQSAMSAHEEREAEAEAYTRANRSSFGESPKNETGAAAEAAPEPRRINLALISWPDALVYAAAAARRVPPASEADRRAWLKYGAMAAAMFGEGWIVGAGAGVANSTRGAWKSKAAQFVGILKATAEAQFGIDGRAFNAIARQIKIPAEIWAAWNQRLAA